MPLLLATAIGSYLIGSLPFSYGVARAFGVTDVRRVGSGNVGATNVLRTAGKAAGVLAFLLDASKGALAAWIALWIAPADPVAPALAAIAAVVGHMYPVWLRFQGGKGVATGLGAFVPLAPLAAGGAVAIFAIVVAATRFVSLGSVAGALALAAFCLVERGFTPVGWSAMLTAALILFRHRSNLRRILGGIERRTGERQE